MNEWSSFISTVGFPIACCCGLAFVLWQMWKSISATCKQLTETNTELVKTNSSLVSSINVKLDKLIEELK